MSLIGTQLLHPLWQDQRRQPEIRTLQVRTRQPRQSQRRPPWGFSLIMSSRTEISLSIMSPGKWSICVIFRSRWIQQRSRPSTTNSSYCNNGPESEAFRGYVSYFNKRDRGTGPAGMQDPARRDRRLVSQSARCDRVRGIGIAVRLAVGGSYHPNLLPYRARPATVDERILLHGDAWRFCRESVRDRCVSRIVSRRASPLGPGFGVGRLRLSDRRRIVPLRKQRMGI